MIEDSLPRDIIICIPLLYQLHSSLPVSQCVPVNPSRHIHVYVDVKSLHAASLKQGLLSQSSVSGMQFLIVYTFFSSKEEAV